MPPVFSINNGSFRYIWSPDSLEELYDLKNDPHELINLAKKNPDLAIELNKVLVGLNPLLKDPAKIWAGSYGDDIPENVREKLKALGYLK